MRIVRRSGQRNERDEQGFTLIEVMIAFTIMGVGLLTIGLAQLTAMRITTMSKQMSQASYLAHEQIEFFRMYPELLTAGGNGVVQDPNNPIDLVPAGVPANEPRDFSSFSRSWNVQRFTPTPSTHTVSVTVTWVQMGGGDSRQRSIIVNGIVHDPALVN